MPINGINTTLEFNKTKFSQKQKNVSQTSANNQKAEIQTQNYASVPISAVNFGRIKKSSPVMQLSFGASANKNPKQYMQIMAELKPFSYTGGAAVVGQDLASIYPDFNNSEHSFFIPYYNGEEIKNDKGFTTGYKVREDEKGPYYIKHDFVNTKKPDEPGYAEAKKKEEDNKIRIEKVATKEIEWGINSAKFDNDTPVALYRVKRDEMKKKHFPDNTNVYLVSTPLTSAMEKEYGQAYNDGNLGNVYSQFSKAVAELAPSLAKEENGGFNPQNVLCHDWHTSFFLKFAQDKALKGNDYYKDIKPGYIIHNGGRSYQGVAQPEELFAQLADKDQLKAVLDDPEYKNLAYTRYLNSIQNIPSVNIDKKMDEYFEELMPKLKDDKGAYNASMIPIQQAKDNYTTIHTVSNTYAQELTKYPGLTDGLMKQMKYLVKTGKLTGIVNGLSTPGCDPASTNGYPAIYKDFKTYTPSDDIETIAKAKHENKMNFMKRLVPVSKDKLKDANPADLQRIEDGKDIKGYLDVANIIPNYNKTKNNLFGHLDEKLVNDPETKLVVGWGRGTLQKGLDISLGAVEKFFEANKDSKTVFVLGGALVPGDPEGDKIREKALELAEGKLKGKLVYIDGFAPGYVMASAADYAMFTSRDEPCGLVQLEGMKYGAIPIVTRTGGLADTVNDPDDENDKPLTGYKTDLNNSFLLDDERIKENLGGVEIKDDNDRRKYRDQILSEDAGETLERALETPDDKRKEMIKTCMNLNVGWDKNTQFQNGWKGNEDFEGNALDKLQAFHFGRPTPKTPSSLIDFKSYHGSYLNPAKSGNGYDYARPGSRRA